MRAFRKIAEETKNHDLERDLYIEERKAERGVYLRKGWEELKKEGWRSWPRDLLRLPIHGFWIFIMALFWALADYGRNVLAPAIWLGLGVPFFYWRYSEILAPLVHEAGPANGDKYNHAVWMLAFGSAVTIDSAIKKFSSAPALAIAFPFHRKAFKDFADFWPLILFGFLVRGGEPLLCFPV